MKIHLPSFLRRKSHPSSPRFPDLSSSPSLLPPKTPLPSDKLLSGFPFPERTGSRFLQETVYFRDPNLELQEAFQRFDANGDGKISVIELGSILKSLGDEPSDEELFLMVKEVDRDGDGFIDLEEFIMLNTTTSSSSSSSAMESQGLRDAFQVFDLDADGKISAQELHSVLLRLGESCTVEECGRMIRGVDTDGDGYVDFKEFCDMMALPH